MSLTVNEFLETDPCLEELDGFIWGLKWQGVISTDALSPIEAYRKRLLSGKVIPRTSRIKRKHKYQQGRKPRRTR